MHHACDTNLVLENSCWLYLGTRVACSLYGCALSCTADCSRNILNLVSENFVLLLNLVLGFSKTPLFLTWVAFTLTRAKRFYFGSWIHSQARANVNATHAQKRSFRKFQLDPTKLSTYSCMLLRILQLSILDSSYTTPYYSCIHIRIQLYCTIV